MSLNRPMQALTTMVAIEQSVIDAELADYEKQCLAMQDELETEGQAEQVMINLHVLILRLEKASLSVTSLIQLQKKRLDEARAEHNIREAFNLKNDTWVLACKNKIIFINDQIGKLLPLAEKMYQKESKKMPPANMSALLSNSALKFTPPSSPATTAAPDELGNTSSTPTQAM